MKKTKALIIMNIVLIILSDVLLILVFIDGVRGNPSVSDGLLFVAMILNIISNVIMLNKNAQKYLDETQK